MTGDFNIVLNINLNHCGFFSVCVSYNKSVSKSLIMNLDVFVIQYYCECKYWFQ